MSNTRHKKNSEYKKGPHLVLIGFMGSGKTSIGRSLSYKLKRAFYDTDKMIEDKEGITISEIFAVKGEKYFRELETSVLREIREDKIPRIYSLGGGTPVSLQNQPLIKTIGTVVYLRLRPEEVWERLKGDTTRPLLQCDDPLARIQSLMKLRAPAYERCADIIIDNGSKDRDEVITEILGELEKRGWKIPPESYQAASDKAETENNE
ncbi:MAG: shikimate kinase [Lachnospiraceae bacterium]|nr:shikimate kinase [Lachnospiraceae bacterium]